MELLDTLVGAIVGALFAVGTTAWFFRAEGRRNYNGRLDDALVAIMRAIPARVEALDSHQRVLDEYERRGGGSPPLAPGPYEIGVLLEAARLVARDPDTKTLASVADAFYSLTDLQPLAQRARLSQLSERIRHWRQGELGPTPWSTFSKMAFDIDGRTGKTPPPPWDLSNRIVTNAGSSYAAKVEGQSRRRWRRLFRKTPPSDAR
ncbi:hypothetical protein [Microbacterium sp. H83]|uniref:hypothetical protein n=1 Tax=Microbacterium sp. H83 TaxID=1827324 RepID=UPI0012F83B12|nr:hypothetical protein [Microbacterium sp. H83]